MRTRPPVKYPGGKFYLAPSIKRELPVPGEVNTYVEPYGGGASMLLLLEPYPVEVYNDIDGRICNLFQVLRRRPELFSQWLHLTPYHEKEFSDAGKPFDGVNDKDVEQARRDYVRWRQSFAGMRMVFGKTLHRSSNGMADVVSAWLSSIDENLPLVIERLRRVQCLNQQAMMVISKYDAPETLFYLDPPYLPGTRKSKEIYRHEMTEEDHGALLRLCCNCEGYIAISGYPSKLYKKMLKSWRMVEYTMSNHMARSKKKQRMRECVWMNYD